MQRRIRQYPAGLLLEMLNKLKAAMVISTRRAGGAERVMSLMASYWAAHGWSVSLITLDAPGPFCYPLHPDVNYMGLNLSEPLEPV